METNNNTKIILAIVAFVILGGVFSISLQGRDGTPHGQEQEGVQKNPLMLQGTVTGTNAAKMQITVTTTVNKVIVATPVDGVLQNVSKQGVSTTTAEKTIAITPLTRIEKILSQKNAKEVVEKQTVVEVNIEDVTTDALVTIFYQSEKDGVLLGVSQISFAVEADIDEYFRSQATKIQTPYLKGKVVTLDSAGKTLLYQPYIFNVVGTTTKSVVFSDGIPVYTIDDLNRVAIIHARAPATLANVEHGRTVFILAEPQALKVGKVVPQTFIILAK